MILSHPEYPWLEGVTDRHERLHLIMRAVNHGLMNHADDVHYPGPHLSPVTAERLIEEML